MCASGAEPRVAPLGRDIHVVLMLMDVYSDLSETLKRMNTCTAAWVTSRHVRIPPHRLHSLIAFIICGSTNDLFRIYNCADKAIHSQRNCPCSDAARHPSNRRGSHMKFVQGRTITPSRWVECCGAVPNACTIVSAASPDPLCHPIRVRSAPGLFHADETLADTYTYKRRARTSHYQTTQHLLTRSQSHLTAPS